MDEKKGAPVKERKADRRRREMAERGLRRVSFVVPLDLWDRWVAAHPVRDGKINDLFVAWLAAGVENDVSR